MINEFLYSFNGGIATIVEIISLISGIIGVIAFLIDKENNKVIKLITIIISLIVFVISLYASKLVRVPDVTNIFYENACNVLAERGLRYNLEYDEGNLVVINQNPKANEVVTEGSCIQLELRELTEDEKRRKIFYEKYAEKAFLELELSLYKKELEFFDGTCSTYYGDKILFSKDMEIYLYVEDENVTLRDYEILDDNRILFKNIPSGLEYSIYCKSGKYDSYANTIKASSSMAVDNRMKMDIHLVENDAEVLFPNRIRIVDSNNNFMEDVICYVGYENSQGIIWSDGGVTDSAGYMGVSIFMADDASIWVEVKDPYRNGIDYKCEVPIRVPKIGEAVDSSIIKVYKDGRCEVMYTSEFFFW